MRLFYAPETISVAVAIVLQEAGVNWDAVRIDFANAEQTKADYLSINPKGRVPTLQTTDGKLLTETGALLEYVAAQAPQAGLVPDGAEDLVHMRAVMYYIASTMHVAHAHKMRGHRWADSPQSYADMKAKVPQTMLACAQYVEAECLRGDYVLGDQFSVADPYLFIVCYWLEGDGVDMAKLPAIRAFLDRMEARDSVQTVRAQGML